MSTDISPYSHTHVEPVNDYPSASKICDDSSATAKYDDLVHSSALFWQKLGASLGVSSNTFKVPTVGGNTLDLHRRFIEVTSRGGFQRVIKDRKWQEVSDAFNFATTSFILRKYYLQFLYELEHVYYLEKPVSSGQSTGIDEPQVGYEVHGIIDGKFDSGYLVTVKIGSEELKGVMYHIPSAIVPSPQRWHKKKSRLAQVDSQKPKRFRTGYNYFFAEQYVKLKPEYLGQEQRTIAKIIGHMWSNLTESEKQVYQNKGVKDAARYRTEMWEYKSSQESGAAMSTVAHKFFSLLLLSSLSFFSRELFVYTFSCYEI